MLYVILIHHMQKQKYQTNLNSESEANFQTLEKNSYSDWTIPILFSDKHFLQWNWNILITLSKTEFNLKYLPAVSLLKA